MAINSEKKGKWSSEAVLDLYSRLLTEIWETVSALIGESVLEFLFNLAIQKLKGKHAFLLALKVSQVGIAVRLIVKNLNILRFLINPISTRFEIKEIVAAAGTPLPNLFQFSSFGLLWKEGPSLYLFQEKSCPASFTQEVVRNMVKIYSLLGEDPTDPKQISLHMEKSGVNPKLSATTASGSLKSHLTLPLAIEDEIMGCLSINSDRPNAFDAQDLQFFSVIGYQMAATLKHFQRFRSIKNIAIYDTLTGLHNRRYFEERLGLEGQKAFSASTPLSLVMVDIDHFKKVNATFGHTEGDKVLREISSALKASVRKKAIVARYGGGGDLFF